MKPYLLSLCLLLVSASLCRAQTRVVLLRDTTQLGISLSALKRHYPAAVPTKANPKALFSRHLSLFLDTLRSNSGQLNRYIENNRRRLAVVESSLQTQEFIKPDGSYDWVFCRFLDTTLTDRQERLLVQILSEWYTRQPFPVEASTGFWFQRFIAAATFGAKRTVRRGTGLIATLDEAARTTRPDTVKVLAFNQLGLLYIPEVVYRFPNLEELDLSKNRLNEVPARLTMALPKLQRLSLRQNVIPDDSVFFALNRSLLSLNLQGNKLTHIPTTVRLNRRLQSLWIGNNNLTDVDWRTLRRLRRLNDLNLYNAGLPYLPKQLSRLRRLTVLDVYYNQLSELPTQLGRMKRLEQLAVSYNNLSELPKSLARLRRLNVLYAHHNRISKLPDDFKRLKRLSVLDLGYNWISAVPPVLAQLPALEELDLNNNNIQEFPTVLNAIPNLKKVYLGSNPLFGKEAMSSSAAPHIKALQAKKTDVFY